LKHQSTSDNDRPTCCERKGVTCLDGYDATQCRSRRSIPGSAQTQISLRYMQYPFTTEEGYAWSCKCSQGQSSSRCSSQLRSWACRHVNLWLGTCDFTRNSGTCIRRVLICGCYAAQKMTSRNEREISGLPVSKFNAIQLISESYLLCFGNA